MYFANVYCGLWNLESGLAPHARIHDVYLHGSCTVEYLRKREHEAKVCLTMRDIEDGSIESAEVRMGKEDGDSLNIVPNVLRE